MMAYKKETGRNLQPESHFDRDLSLISCSINFCS